MTVDDVIKSIEGLSLSPSGTYTSGFGETYTVGDSGKDVFIKGSRRKDGSFRRDIRVRPGYIPPEERAVYVPRFRRSPELSQPAELCETDKKDSIKKKGVSVQSVSRTSVKASCDKIPANQGSSGSKTTDNPGRAPITDNTESLSNTDSSANLLDTGAVHKLINAIRHTKRKIRNIQGIGVSEGGSLSESQVTRLDTLNAKLKHLESELAAIKTGVKDKSVTD
uniref:WIBG Mago-binding domain-containing protein n=1 Tax=Babesia bovis TaxID=5865 RepID=S6B251_BABBO|nr:hypothetical protein [Babesia bovis]